MSDQESIDQEVEQEIDLEAIAAQEQEVEEVIDQVDEVELSPIEQKAFDQGWRPQEEFSGPEENWKTAKEYVKDGEWISQINSLKGQIDKQQQEFDSRLENTNKLHEARRQAEIKQLKAKQREAVDMSDTDTFDAAQKQIDELEEQKPVDKVDEQPGKDPTIAAWEKENPWINEQGNDKGIYATGVWNNFLASNPNATVEQALNHVDEKVASVFPSSKVNPRRNQPNVVENNSRKPSRQSKTLSMGDLTAEERNDWNQFGSQMFTEAEFLKTVADTRTK